MRQHGFHCLARSVAALPHAAASTQHNPSLTAELTPTSLLAQKVCCQNACLLLRVLSCAALLGACQKVLAAAADPSLCLLASSRCFVTFPAMLVCTVRKACFSYETCERKAWKRRLRRYIANSFRSCARFSTGLNITPAGGISACIYRPLFLQA